MDFGRDELGALAVLALASALVGYGTASWCVGIGLFAALWAAAGIVIAHVSRMSVAVLSDLTQVIRENQP
jgi:hypothetical protein